MTAVRESILSPHREFLWTMKRPVSQTAPIPQLTCFSFPLSSYMKQSRKTTLKKMGISFCTHLCQSRLHLWLSGLQDGVICYLKEKYINRIKRDDIKLQLSSLSFSYFKDTAWTIFANLAGYVTIDYPNVLMKWGSKRKK